MPKILLTHPPPKSREALPPIRTFLTGQKDINVVPPLPKKIPPVPDDIKLPLSMRHDIAGGANESLIDNETPLTSGIAIQEPVSSENISTAIKDQNDEQLTEVAEASKINEEDIAGEQITDRLQQMKESSSIQAPATVIMTDEATKGKSLIKSKSNVKKTITKTSKPTGRFTRKPDTSTLSRLAKPKTASTRKPPLKSLGAKSAPPSKRSRNAQVSLPNLEADHVQKGNKINSDNVKDAFININVVSVSNDEPIFEPINKLGTSIGEIEKDNATLQISKTDKNNSLEHDLTIVSTINGDFSSVDSSNGAHKQANEQMMLSQESEVEEDTFDSTKSKTEENSTAIAQDLKNKEIDVESNIHLVRVGEGPTMSDRLPSRESTASIASSVNPTMTAVESVMPLESTSRVNGISKMPEDSNYQDTDYSSDSFSSDSEDDLPITKTLRKSHQFLMEPEITHVPLSHPKTPFMRDVESRADTRTTYRKMDSATTQRRAMSSRLLSSSYGSRPNLQVQAYNPMEDAKQKSPEEREKKKAQVAAEKADAKKKGFKRLKAMKTVYGNLKMPARR